MASMGAQTVTPMLLGLLLRAEGINWSFLPFYAIIATTTAAVIFFFVKNIKNKRTKNVKGLEALGEAED